MQTCKEIACEDDRARFFLAGRGGRTEAKAFDVEITSIILVCDQMTTILFNPGSTIIICY